MPNLSQGSDRFVWPGKETDFWKQNIVLTYLYVMTVLKHFLHLYDQLT